MIQGSSKLNFIRPAVGVDDDSNYFSNSRKRKILKMKIMTNRFRLMLSITLVVLFDMVSVTDCIITSPPLIVEHPSTRKEILYRPIEDGTMIRCVAEGEPAPKYTWYKNGKIFDWQIDDTIRQVPGEGTLLIFQDDASGLYQCYAKNEFGIATSESVFIRKAELHSFKVEPPKTQLQDEGQPARLECHPPDGYPKPDLFWVISENNKRRQLINSSRLTVDPEGSLWFSYVRLEDNSTNFQYACAASSNFLSEYKVGNFINLKVVKSESKAGKTKNQPEMQFMSRKYTTTLKEDILKLWCIYSGNPVPTIIWTKKNDVMPFDRVTYDNFGKTLVISDVGFDESGTYQCEASNGVGQTQTYEMNVQVLARPSLTVVPEIQNMAEGETAIFKCEATGRPKPLISWFVDGKPIRYSPVNQNRYVMEKEIKIFNVTKMDTGNYGCNASNEYGYSYREAYLNVLALPPEILELPDDVNTVDGKDVKMSCKVFAVPKPDIVWWRNDDQILSEDRFKISEEGDLLIKDVSFMDEGYYTCRASNRFGSGEAQTNLKIFSRTTITERPEDYAGPVGSEVNFRCSAISDPRLELIITWKVDMKTIDFDVEPRFVKERDNSLTIINTNALDSRRYTCVASTSLDEDTKSAVLIVEDVPNPPRIISLDCFKEEATITWQPRGDSRSPVLGFLVQHNTSFIPDIWNDSLLELPPNTTQARVYLSPWTSYSFRVLARNTVGYSLPSKFSSTCSTTADVPYKSPDNVRVRQSNPSKLVIEWSPMSEIEHNGPAFMYIISWRRNDTFNAVWETAEVFDWTTGVYIVEGQPMKPYRINVEAYNDLGAALNPPVDVIGYAGEDVPLSFPTNFRISEILNETTAALMWQPVLKESVQGRFFGYKIQTWINEDDENSVNEIIVKNMNDTSVTMDSFIPNTINYANILVMNGAYEGPPSHTILLEMPEGKPGPVDSFEADTLSSSTIMLYWQKPKRPDGDLVGYRISYEEIEETSTRETILAIDVPHRTEARLENLKPDTKYKITIQAINRAGIGAPVSTERKTQGRELKAGIIKEISQTRTQGSDENTTSKKVSAVFLIYRLAKLILICC